MIHRYISRFLAILNKNQNSPAREEDSERQRAERLEKELEFYRRLSDEAKRSGAHGSSHRPSTEKKLMKYHSLSEQC